MQIYLVGGAVRDKLLGLEVKDCDYVVVGTTAEQMVAQGYKPVGADFPVFLHPQTKEEYALARTERKSGRGYKGFTVYAAPDVTLEDDLRRRDLTINAMAESEDGTLIDPFGGANDLRNGILRHVSPAFAEDPVRVLRVARFAARYATRGFQVATSTLALMREMVESGEVNHLVAERVWAETEGALGEQAPPRFFEALRECGALARVFPEIEALFGVPQPPQYHPEVDSGLHTMMVLAQAARLSADTRVRFAALVHDLGKGQTPEAEWPKHRGHEERGVELVNNLCRRLRVPNDYRELALVVARYHLRCHRATELRAATILDTLEAVDVFRRPERFEPFLLACEADMRGRTGWESKPYPQADVLQRAFEAAHAVDTAAIAAEHEGLDGSAIGKKIHDARVAAIKKIL
ncbi:MAG: multifunctional CCA addition/repair protein [Acidiferrobacterales bacterium]|nr:multifunctional CCA addition/repair protein [Acidiferrobacterales bacterium]